MVKQRKNPGGQAGVGMKQTAPNHLLLAIISGATGCVKPAGSGEAKMGTDAVGYLLAPQHARLITQWVPGCAGVIP